MGDSEVVLLPRTVFLYCSKCGMPPEFCEYGPDYETHCAPWLSKNHRAIFDKLQELRGGPKAEAAVGDNKPDKPPKPANPWTIEERLTAFYQQYQPDKLDSVPGLLEKYVGKEDKLFVALTKKYGPEPNDPYYSESEDEDEDEEDVGEEDMANLAVGDKKKRRGAGANKKKSDKNDIRVVVQKRAQNRRRILTVVMGMDTVPDIKLKDVSKTFSKKFAGSSSVKDTAKGGKEIIIQGDHVFDVAEMIVDKLGVAETNVFVDCDGEITPLK